MAGSGTLSSSQVDAIRQQAGLPVIFDWIAQAESGDRPGVVNGIGATGLWQIYNHPDLVRRFGVMTDPVHNARAAKVLYDQSGLAPWVSSRAAWGNHLGSGPLLGGSNAAPAASAQPQSAGTTTAAAGGLFDGVRDAAVKALLWVCLLFGGAFLAYRGTSKLAGVAAYGAAA